MVDRKKNRSDYYQAIFAELPYSNEMMAEFAEESNLINTSEYNEELLDLKDALKVEFWRLVDTQLTPRQREVIRLYAEGYTQIEIAKKLNVNQSSITKSINGNTDYKNGRTVYGGSKSKLKKLIAKDDKIQKILKRIAELSE